MKKSLFISALVAFVMMFCVNVNAQEKATGKAYKDLKKQEKVLDKELQKKAIKEARKEAKKLEKEGTSEDICKSAEEEVQNLTNSFIKKIDEHLAIKEAEIMKV